jgi:hypothetical protein
MQGRATDTMTGTDRYASCRLARRWSDARAAGLMISRRRGAMC